MKDSRKEIISWSLYDWANSAFATTVMAAFFPIFFSQYWSYGADSAESTFFLGMGNSLASLLVAVMSPIIGAIADKGSYRKKLLILFAFLGAASTAGLFLVSMGMWPLAIILYVIANIGFASANTFYDSLLPTIASEKKVDFVSSLGYSLGYIGGGLLFLLNVLMYLMPQTFGLADEIMAVRLSFLMVGVWWIVFSVPLLLFVKEPEGQRMKLSTAMKEGFGDLKNTLKSLRKLKNTAFFLVAYWCYIDGVDTIIRMATDYGTALGFSASSLIVFQIGESSLSNQARVNLGMLAEVIKQGDASTVYTITGYADAGTGSKKTNERLSKERAEAVRDCLVKEFGVDKSQLKVDYKGGVENMFYDDPRMSRAVITTSK